jgi:hypothetical protein
MPPPGPNRGVLGDIGINDDRDLHHIGRLDKGAAEAKEDGKDTQQGFRGRRVVHHGAEGDETGRADDEADHGQEARALPVGELAEIRVREAGEGKCHEEQASYRGRLVEEFHAVMFSIQALLSLCLRWHD